MQAFEKKLYAELIEQKIVPEDVLQGVIDAAAQQRVVFTELLVSQGVVDEDVLLSMLAQCAGLTFVDLKKTKVDPQAIEAVPVKFAWHYRLVPLSYEGKKLTIAVNAPLSLRDQDELHLILGYTIVPVLARREQIDELLKLHYGVASDTVDKMMDGDDQGQIPRGKNAHEDIQDIEKLADDASVIKLVNQIILEAYKQRATDIHIEPFRGKLKLRYRVDGILHDQKVSEDVSRFLLPVLSRIKIMSNLDIIERRIPQDGRATVKTQDQVLDLRVSFIPTPHGESVVIRLLPTKMFFSLGKLGFAKDDVKLFSSLIKKPNGIIFVTGPTGSGKTTTLYACLKEMDKTRRKIITIEDPIEYEMDAITQIQVNSTVGLTFAKGLRSMLRHDPDVMMVGEVRDRETAEIAIRVALTGHLVLSTLHTNDAASGITRLLDIGIEPYLIASSVEAFMAQRLVRVICPDCKTQAQNSDVDVKRAMVKRLGLGFDDDIKIYTGKGCDACSFTGFRGRTAIYEMLLVDEQVKRIITERGMVSHVRKYAQSRGMKSLLQDGWEKALAGVTTPEEVMNVCQDFGLTMPSAGASDQQAPAEVSTAKSDILFREYPQEKRLYLRMPRRISMQYRLVEKGKGDIQKLEQVNKNPSPESVFSAAFRAVSAKKEDEKGLEEVYQEAFTATTNISAGGLVFESDYSLPIGSIIELKIHLPNDSIPLRCFAKVVRMDDDISKCFYIAVCYLDLSGVDRGRIDTFVKNELTKQQVIDIDNTGDNS